MPYILSILLLCIALSSQAMPPAPGVIEQLDNDGQLQNFISSQMDARSRGMNASFPFALPAMQRDGIDEVTLRVVCILVDFNDNVADAERFPVEHFEEMLFSMGEYRTGSMRDYYLENSYDDVNIIGDVVGWLRMPQDYAYYVNGQRGFGQYPRNGMGLARDAILAADEFVDYHDYDNNNNGIAEGVLVVHAGPGAETNGSNDMIWSHAWQVPNDVRPDNVGFRSYAMEPEDGRVGVFGHELAHSLFGLPDLYDGTYESAGVGGWSMMAGGSWGGGGNRPVHFDAWCKARLGFADPFPIIEDRTEIVMEPIERFGDILLAWRVNDWNEEYFLIENRQRIGFDESLPGSGTLIWHCDDEAENNNHPWWPGQEGAHNILALEQADGEYDMERNANGGDGADPWPGEAWADLFGSDTQPNSRDYAGEATDVTVLNFEALDEGRMSLDVLVSQAPEPIYPELFLLERIPASHRFLDPDARVDADTTDEVSLLKSYLRWMGAMPSGEGDQLPANLLAYNIVVYIESWRDGEELSEGLSVEEQQDLAVFLETGGMLILIGPDIAANIADDDILWPYLHAEYLGDGEPRETGNLRRLTANPQSRIAGENFVYLQRSENDHYVDIVGPGDRARSLFTDQEGNERGIMYAGDYGYRVILQPFLLGGMVDWGGSKARLLQTYFEYLRFVVTDVQTSVDPAAVSGFKLISLYPNPFNGIINVKWEGAPQGAKMDIHDVSGRKIGALSLSPGAGSTNWSPNGLSAGVYYFQPGLPGASPRPVVFLK
jgi:M6 family metalloprotease-like protein